MVLGFNHNIQYKGELFHIQTEDSGVDAPHITTLLYLGGTIISSNKTSYADIIKVDNLEKVVEELMKDQHKAMLRRLKSGEFDERAFGGTTAEARNPAAENESNPVTQPALPDESPDNSAEGNSKNKLSLDEIILDYLVAGESE
jgi:hypothetical protein